MSIITKGRITELLQSGWVSPVIVVFIFSINVIIFEFEDYINWIQGIVILLLILGGPFLAVLSWYKTSQDDIVRYHNVKKALNNGFLVIATNDNDTLCEIADEVSYCLERLGIDHRHSGKYIRHIVDEKDNVFHEVSVDYIKLTVSPNYKNNLSLIISANAVSNKGVVSVKVSLLDNGGKSVVKNNTNTAIVVFRNNSGINHPNRSAKNVAKEIVGTIFTRLNLKIWAATV